MLVLVVMMMMLVIKIIVMILMLMVMAAPVEHCLDLGLWQDWRVALLQRLLIVVHLRRCDNANNRCET